MSADPHALTDPVSEATTRRPLDSSAALAISCPSQASNHRRATKRHSPTSLKNTCHSERSEESTGATACECHAGFFAALRMTALGFLACFLPLSASAATATAAATPSDVPAPVAAERPLAQDDFVAVLARDLSAHFNLEGDLQLELLRPWSPPERVARDWKVEITDYPSLPAASMLVRCRVFADGTAVTSADETLVLRAMLWRDVWVARRPLEHGATFDPALLDSRRVDLFRDRDALPAAVGDRTFIFARSVQAGRLLTWRDIARRPLVRKGELVDVSAAEGQLIITMKALAMQNGAQGEAITVRNVESRKDFTAFVVDESHVQVRF
jgi:flagella basal body P-ring formation protein FlgA